MIATYFILECQIGYYWDNCSKTCPYPHYGNRCRQKCSCPVEICDFMTGCSKGKYIKFGVLTFLLLLIVSLINEKKVLHFFQSFYLFRSQRFFRKKHIGHSKFCNLNETSFRRLMHL